MFTEFIRDEVTQVAAYKRLASFITNLIIKNKFKKGEMLPSVRFIAGATGLSINTVTHALEILQSEGFIRIEPKKRPVVINNLKESAKPDFEWELFTGNASRIKTADEYGSQSLIRSKSNLINIYEMRLGREFDPGRPITEAMRKVTEKGADFFHSSFFDVTGIKIVRELVGAHLRKYDIYAESSEIIMTSGPLNAMDMVASSLMRPGMPLYLPIPNILDSVNIFKKAGLNVIGIPQDDDGIIPEAFEALIKRKGGLLFVNGAAYLPNMARMTEERIKQVLDIAVRNRIIVMENDMMREYWLDEKPPRTFKSFDKSGNVIYIFSFTRGLFPGMRIAAIATGEQVIDVLSDVKLQTEWCTDSISQLLMGELLNNNLFINYMDSIRPALIQRRDDFEALLIKHLGDLAHWRKVSVGLNFWLEFDKSVDTALFHTERRGVLTYSGSVHGKSFKNCLWVCFSGVTLDEADTALRVISEAARKRQ